MLGAGSHIETFRRAESGNAAGAARVSRNEWGSSNPAWLLKELEQAKPEIPKTRFTAWTISVRAAVAKLAAMLF